MEHPENIVPVVAPGFWRRSYPWLRSLAQLVIAGGILAGLLWRVNLGEVRDELESANLWWLPLAFFANIASDWFRAIRWRQFIQPLKAVSLSFLFITSVLGVACNLALPLRAGEFIRVQVVRRRTGLRVSAIVATLLSEKLMDIVAFCSFLALGIVLYEEARFMWPLAVVYAAVLAAGIYFARRLAEKSDREQVLETQPEGRLRAWLWLELHTFGQGLQAFRRPRAMFTVIWASHAAWLIEAVMYYACGRALGLDLPIAVYLLMVVTATIAVSVPLTQAGLGVFELALTGLLVAFHVNESQAAAFAIFTHVMLAVPYLATGPLAAIALRLNFSDIFFMRAPPPEEPQPAAV